jgi:uncharacterized protein
MADKDTSNRGFGGMDERKQRDIASKGGHAAHEKGTAHEFSSEEAEEAGRIGGQHSHGEHPDGSHQSSNEQKDQDHQHSSSSRGGTSQQHADAGRQSHKNS